MDKRIRITRPLHFMPPDQVSEGGIAPIEAQDSTELYPTPTNQPDSQAGDELDDIVNVSYGKATMLQQTPYIEAEIKRQTKVAIRNYADRLATKRAIEEARLWKYHMDRAEDSEASSMFLDTRIKELSATLTNEAEK